mmetsp:Transcript_26735/g.35613  ORF Transcript_26735/g.35613 Transcript_26735/m.35613 type:complete len:87 (+) Transcript_26735:693-953(+)
MGRNEQKSSDQIHDLLAIQKVTCVVLAKYFSKKYQLCRSIAPGSILMPYSFDKTSLSNSNRSKIYLYEHKESTELCVPCKMFVSPR